MATPDGRWRVEQITVQRGGRTLTRPRVSTFGGVFVAEVADLDRHHPGSIKQRTHRVLEWRARLRNGGARPTGLMGGTV
jgi:hypothetical protein